MDINMSGTNAGQLHHLTLGIYSNLMDDFNPSLQRLVALGNSYAQAFKALAVTSEAYFGALSKIGEKAFHSASSRPLGEVLMQISENQKKLTLELEGIFRWFTVEVLLVMNDNIRQDRGYIADSRDNYEMMVQKQAAALERQMRRGGKSDNGEHVQFFRESYNEALKEEERRHRFLAEKHCGLIQNIAGLMNKVGGSLQQRADAWTKEVNATREPEGRRPASEYNSIQDSRPGRELKDSRSGRELKDSRSGREMKDSRPGREMKDSRSGREPSLGRMPSRAPSPQGGVNPSRAESVSGGGGGRVMKALVDHFPSGSNQTVLPFNRGEMITVLVQQPRNGWLYGRTDISPRPGWFPASYAEDVDSFSRSSGPPLRSSSSTSNLLDQSGGSSQSRGSPAPPPPPLPPPSSFSDQPEKQPVKKTEAKRNEPRSEKKAFRPEGAPELFPRGTNPFATVKLKPTTTDDRSAPRLYRR